MCRLLVRYFVDVCSRGTLSCRMLDGIAQQLYKLIQMSSLPAAEELTAVLRELNKRCFSTSKRHSNFPGANVVGWHLIHCLCS